MTEQRRAGRWEIGRQAKIKLSGAYAFADCQIKDLNFKGVQLALKIKLPLDAFFQFSLNLSEDIILDIEAWVAWHKPIDGHNLYGLYFSKITDLDKEKIYKFLHRDFSTQIRTKWWPDKHIEKGGEAMDTDRIPDRRIFARFPARFPVRFLDLSSNKEGQGTTRDISAKGLGLILNTELAAQTPIELWVDIPDQGESLYTRGEVIWSDAAGNNEYRSGINLEKADLMGLARVLRVE